ncbi:efflux transporter, RND family, MFP subunit, partial [sediment metagenome]
PLNVITTHKDKLNSFKTTISDYDSILNNFVDDLENKTQAVKDAEFNVLNKKQDLQDIINGSNSLSVRSKKISIQQKKNQLNEAQKALNDYYVYAPFDGILSELNVSVGEKVSTSTNIGILISEQNSTQIEFNEIDFIKIKKGQKAIITFDALEDITLEGYVSDLDITGTVSSGVVTYNVEIIFDGENEEVKNGMNLSVEIITDSNEQTIVVPNSTLSISKNKTFVSILENGIVKQIEVETGVKNDTQTEIISGLSVGDELIIKENNVVSDSSENNSATTTTNKSNSIMSGFGGGAGIGGGPPDAK